VTTGESDTTSTSRTAREMFGRAVRRDATRSHRVLGRQCCVGDDVEGGPGRVVIRRVPMPCVVIVWSPDELGIARAFVAGDIDLIGPLAPLLRSLQDALPTDARIAAAALPKVLAGGRAVGALGRPLPPPPEEFVPRGVRHSLRRDKSTISHHYDVGNDFYELVLGPAMTYSCARFVTPDTSLEDAQAAKHDLICRKLGLDDPTERGRRAPATARRRLRLGVDGDPRRDPPRRRRRRRDDQRRAGRSPAAGRRCRTGRSGRDPGAGLPRGARRPVRRDLVDRDGRTRRQEEHGGLLPSGSTTCCVRAAGS
jgi:hypothetical protein